MKQDLPLEKILDQGKKIFSVEFFPPKSDAMGEQLIKAAEKIKPLNPDFVTITYGAGGSTRQRTLDYACKLKDEVGFSVMPHLTCVGHSKAELLDILKSFHDTGFKNIMALRGDPPKGETNFKPHPEGLAYASELVALIKENYPEFSLGVAGYPEKHMEAVDLQSDISSLAHKVSQGASFVTTQLFFDNQYYFKYVELCKEAGISIPILPGILPALSLDQLRKFCSFGGSSIPAELESRLTAVAGNKEQEAEVGETWAFEQIKELLERGAPGVHFYILNRSKTVCSLMQRLKDSGIEI